jgi:hypothetical protein
MVLSKEQVSVAVLVQRRLPTPESEALANYSHNIVLKTYRLSTLDTAPVVEQLSPTAISCKKRHIRTLDWTYGCDHIQYKECWSQETGAQALLELANSCGRLHRFVPSKVLKAGIFQHARSKLDQIMWLHLEFQPHSEYSSCQQNGKGLSKPCG